MVELGKGITPLDKKTVFFIGVVLIAMCAYSYWCIEGARENSRAQANEFVIHRGK